MWTYVLILLAVALSLYFWGLLRSGLWLIPALLSEAYLPLASACLLSFFAVSIWLLPYRKGAFDSRDISKERVALLFFLTGVLTGALVWSPTPLWIFVGGAIFPWILLQIFQLFRMPASRVLYLPQRPVRWVVSLTWILIFCVQIVERFRP